MFDVGEGLPCSTSELLHESAPLMYSEPPPPRFSGIFPEWLGIVSPKFTHLL